MKACSSVLTLAMMFSVAAITIPEKVSAKKVTIKKVAVTSPSGKTVYVAAKKKVKLSTVVTATPNKKANKKVTYKSANNKIATVNAKGVVKGVKAGKTKITVVSKKNRKKKATIKVVVVKLAVNKVKLNASKASLPLGSTKKLTATVTPKKGISKKLAWTSSNKKVATVTNSGLVKGVGKGTATITAKATDGSNKKATCKVTVTYSVNLKKVTVLNSQSVSFSLDNAQALNPSQVVIKRKANATGAYRNTLKIQNLTTTDRKNYTAIINSDQSINTNDYVQVYIASLSGTKVMQTIYKEAITAYTAEETCSWTKGSYDSTYVYFDDRVGYASFTVSNLPAGLKYEDKGSSLLIKGTPTVTGSFKTVVKATDEMGNTETRTIYFYIGSDSVIAGAAIPYYTMTRASGSYNVYPYVYFTGGSGSYTYEIVSDPKSSGLTIDYSGSSYVELSGSIATPGSYPITVKATDRANSKLTAQATVVVNVAQGITIAGIIKDANGNPIPYADIYFKNKNKADRYCTSVSYEADSKGAYSATLAAGKYDIEASYQDYSSYSSQARGVNFLFNQSLTTTRSGFDISLPLYKVVLVSSDEKIKEILDDYYYSWKMNEESLGSGNTLYLKAGTYSITTSDIADSEDETTTTSGDWFNGMTYVTTSKTNNYKLTSKFTVTNKAIQTTVTKTASTPKTTTSSYTRSGAKDSGYSVWSLNYGYYLDNAYDNDDDYCVYAYKFTPDSTGQYQFSSSTDSEIGFYDGNGRKLTAEDGVYSLTGGTTYYIGKGEYSDGYFMLEEVEEE